MLLFSQHCPCDASPAILFALQANAAVKGNRCVNSRQLISFMSWRGVVGYGSPLGVRGVVAPLCAPLCVALFPNSVTGYSQREPATSRSALQFAYGNSLSRNLGIGNNRGVYGAQTLVTAPPPLFLRTRYSLPCWPANDRAQAPAR
jgi:hypothetical protein